MLWLMLGFFFLGAISRSILRAMKFKDWFGNREFFSRLKVAEGEDKQSNKLSDNDK